MEYVSLVKKLSNSESSEGVGAAASGDSGRCVRRMMADEQRAAKLVAMMRNAAGEDKFFKYLSDSEETHSVWKDVGGFFGHVPTEYQDLLAYAVMAQERGLPEEVTRVKNVVCGFYGMDDMEFGALVSLELAMPLFDTMHSRVAGSVTVAVLTP